MPASLARNRTARRRKSRFCRAAAAAPGLDLQDLAGRCPVGSVIVFPAEQAVIHAGHVGD